MVNVGDTVFLWIKRNIKEWGIEKEWHTIHDAKVVEIINEDKFLVQTDDLIDGAPAKRICTMADFGYGRCLYDPKQVNK